MAKKFQIWHILIKKTLEKTEGYNNVQSRDSGNIGYIAYDKEKHKKKMSKTGPTKERGWTQVLPKGK